MTPWQHYFFGRYGTPDKAFTWTYHFNRGLEDIIAAFLALWNSVETNKVAGALFPNDGDANALGAADLGFPPILQDAGYKRSTPGVSNRSATILGLKSPPSRTLANRGRG
jgi:branched-chain amino acid transport system substrate-binding protein